MAADAKRTLLAELAERSCGLAILVLLLLLILARTAENLHGQMSSLGAYLWRDYFELRTDFPTPKCDPRLDIEVRLDELEAASRASGNEFEFFHEHFDREAARASLERQKALCVQAHERAALYQSKVTPGLRIFRSLERRLAQLSVFATARQQLLLLILLLIASGLTTWKGRHIALRPMVSALDCRTSLALQFLANAVLAYSAWASYSASAGSGVATGSLQITSGLAVGSALLALISLLRLLALPKRAGSGKSLAAALLSVPLYTIALLIFAFLTFVVRANTPGLAIYLSTFFERSGTYLDVALYLWSGMLLKQTQIGERIFALFTPWRLGPELLALVAVVVGGVPTAYTGASAIIILALGSVVYRELRKLGTRRQLALAATAMSGSSGIVLRPCLLVVLIAMLNKEVVTEELFYWGTRVFLLTVALFAFYAVLTAKGPLRLARPKEPFGATLRNLRSLSPYVLITGLLMGLYAVALDAYLDQFSAPTMLPVLLIAVVLFERRLSKAKPIYRDSERLDAVMGALRKSVSDASVHVGALLLLMATFSVMTGIGGAVASAAFLGKLGSVWAVMAALMVIFVLIGMFMESMAAVGMISLMIAPVAYGLGISPIHFWMTCLTALELGYLTPPVALSHIFCRQVVGEDEWSLAAKEGDTFYYRRERLVLPLMVMATALLIVAFGPLLYGCVFQ